MDGTAQYDQFGQLIAMRQKDGVIEYNGRVAVQSRDTNDHIDRGVNEIREKVLDWQWFWWCWGSRVIGVIMNRRCCCGCGMVRW